jgi:hypothetical protein
MKGTDVSFIVSYENVNINSNKDMITVLIYSYFTDKTLSSLSWLLNND